jgi:polysaccharide biosynthesis/export protein
MFRAGQVRVVGAIAIMIGIGCMSGARSIPDHDYSKEPDPRRSEFVVGVADLLRVDVWRHPELSSNVRVRPDGTITLPLIGHLEAAGQRPSELEVLIRNQLGAWMQDPAIVTVAVQEVQSYRFTVSGHVQSQGVFQLNRYATVVEAIALAGGFTRYAERHKVFVLRSEPDGSMRRIPINFEALVEGEHLEMNITLLPGDMVVVP